MTRRRLGTRSASAPPIRDTKVIGAVNDTIDRLRARGESSIMRTTSQALVIICMFIAMNDPKEPNHIQRKSRYWRESKIGARAREERSPALVGGLAASGPAGVDVFCFRSDFTERGASPRLLRGSRKSLHPVQATVKGLAEP